VANVHKAGFSQIPRAHLPLIQKSPKAITNRKKLGWAMGSPCLACAPHLDACRVDTLFILRQQQTTRPSNSYRQPARLQIESVHSRRTFCLLRAPLQLPPRSSETLFRRHHSPVPHLGPVPATNASPIADVVPAGALAVGNCSASPLPPHRQEHPRLRPSPAARHGLWGIPGRSSTGCRPWRSSTGLRHIHGCGSGGVQPGLGLRAAAAADSYETKLRLQVSKILDDGSGAEPSFVWCRLTSR